MNNNITLLTYLLIPNKKFKIFNFDNYYWKLICILDLNDCYFNNNSKIFYYKYKLECTIYNINIIGQSNKLEIIPR
jgi:hypothetical protein